MKKLCMAFLLTASVLLGGCSLLEGVNDTLTYVNEATEYANEASAFANEVPSLAEQAISDEQALEEFETRLNKMQQDIEEFNELQAPSVASDFHQQIVEYNNNAAEGIDLYLNNIEDGKLDPSVLENTDVFLSLMEINNIVDQIQQLTE